MWWFAVVLLGVVAGPLNGDLPAYVASARHGAVFERATHAGFVVLLLPWAWLPTWGSAVFAGLAAWCLARAGSADRAGQWLALLVVTPVAPFAEVDVVWVAALLASAAAPGWAALAVAVSPSALLALPAMARSRTTWGVAAAMVFALTLVSGGAWWWGERGVLTGPPWLPGRVAAAWGLALPWALLPTIRWDPALRRDLLAAAPLLALPPDVPGWLVPALRLARSVDLTRPSARSWLGLQVVVTAALTLTTVARVHAENEVLQRAVLELTPDDGVVAPFSWGSRLAFAATGDPYGLRWHPPGTFLRDQRAQWCSDPPARVLVLPPGPTGRFEWTTTGGECP